MAKVIPVSNDMITVYLQLQRFDFSRKLYRLLHFSYIYKLFLLYYFHFNCKLPFFIIKYKIIKRGSENAIAPSCLSPCNDFLFLCKDHYENKVAKPVLCHPCQYHLVHVNVYFIFHLFFSVCLFLGNFVEFADSLYIP